MIYWINGPYGVGKSTVAEALQKMLPKANCEYPGIWKGEIERLENLENEVILVGHVYSKRFARLI